MFHILLLMCGTFAPKANSSYYGWFRNESSYQSQVKILVGHSFETTNAAIVTQCALACLKQSKCLSYNFDPMAKKCDLNEATHLSNPSDFKASISFQYIDRGFYTINQKADPCLSLPCSNNGTCLSRNGHLFTCFCSSRWTGKYCSVGVDISWTDWSRWSDCSINCGDGVRQRTRSCYDKSKDMETNARLCHGPKVELEHCLLKDCPNWKEWSEWSSCSTAKTCGEGRSTRSRICLNSDPEVTCFGLANESRMCLSLGCDAEVSIIQSSSESYGEGTLQIIYLLQSDWLTICSKNWTQSNADVSCRQLGFQNGAYSSRFIQLDSKSSLNVDFQCQGLETSLINCPHSDWSVGGCDGGSKILLKCVVDGSWSKWGEWSECSVSCANGVSLRRRNCSSPEPKYGGQSCLGSDTESKSCIRPHCPVNGQWMEWNAWSSCNVTCGGGGQTRVRFCIEPKYGGSYCNGSGTEINSCNTQPCPVDGSWKSWGEWSSCSVSCGGGKRVRSRACNPPLNGGRDCLSDEATSEDFCNDDPCKIDGQWSLWSRWMDCSSSCDIGTERRYRECSIPENGGNTCEGKPEEYRECNVKACPTPGDWSTWSAWSGCSFTCGSSGTRMRSRICNQTLEGIHSLPCPEFNSSIENKDCNRFSCSPSVKSCQEAFERGLEESTYVQINPGGMNSKSFNVLCLYDAGKTFTIVNSSYEFDHVVSFPPGVKKRSFVVIYSSNNVQISTDNMKTLVYNSKECKQLISWKCRNFPINSPSGVKLVLWKNQYSEEMSYWGDANAATATGSSKPTSCSCGENGSCKPFQCSCDGNMTTWSEDGGHLKMRIASASYHHRLHLKRKTCVDELTNCPSFWFGLSSS